MSVSDLLQRVQSLTEEGNAVEEAIRIVDGEISKCKTEMEMIKQRCINTEREIQGSEAANSKNVIVSLVNWEYEFLVTFHIESLASFDVASRGICRRQTTTSTAFSREWINSGRSVHSIGNMKTENTRRYGGGQEDTETLM